jgi:hypothetical protein
MAGTRTRVIVGKEQHLVKDDMRSVVDAIRSALGGGTAQLTLHKNDGVLFVTPGAAATIVVDQVSVKY